MSAQPWMKFYPRDWRGDQALRVVSLAARGMWMEMLCTMHEASPYGHLLVGGQPVSDATLARLVGTSVEEVQALLVELRDAGVFRQTRGGVVYSKRMTDDHKRSVAGRKAKEAALKEAAENAGENPPPSRGPASPPPTQKPDTRKKKEISDANASSVAGTPGDDVRAAFDEWNALAARLGLPKALTLDKDRRTAMRRCLADGGLAVWREALAAVERSPHCRGENDRGWRADLDFVCQTKSWRRLREGFYTADAPDRGGHAIDIPKFSNTAIRSYVAEKMGEPWTISYLDTCSYSEVGGAKTITARNNFIAKNLADGVPALAARGIVVTVAHPSNVVPITSDRSVA